MLSIGINICLFLCQTSENGETAYTKAMRESLVSNCFKYVNVTCEKPFKLNNGFACGTWFVTKYSKISTVFGP